jgi:hypothetical protein
MKRLFAVKNEEIQKEMKDVGSIAAEGLLDSMELDTPTKPKQTPKNSTKKTKRKIDLGEFIPSEKSPPTPNSHYHAASSPSKRVTKSVQHDDSKLKTPIRSSKRLGIKRKIVPVFSPPRNESSEESPTRKVHFAVVPDSDPFCSPKQEARVPDIQVAPKTLFEQVFPLNVDNNAK